MKLRDVAVLSALGALALAFFVPARAACQDGKAKTKCTNNLKQLGLAAIQYSDDKRFFPHLGPIKELDNEGETKPSKNPVPPRCLRALIHFNYLDAPETFVCPEAPDDGPKLLSDKAKEDIRCFGWKGAEPADKTISPIAKGMAEDRDADALNDLSYGYTLRGLSSNALSSTRIVADRARRAGPRKNARITGNHKKGYNVVCVDAHTEFVGKDDDDASTLAGTKGKQPALVVWDEKNSGDPVDEEKDEKKEDKKKPEAKSSPCDTCGEPCPDDAATCPHCGMKNGKKKDK